MTTVKTIWDFNSNRIVVIGNNPYLTKNRIAINKSIDLYEIHSGYPDPEVLWVTNPEFDDKNGLVAWGNSITL